MTDPIAALRGQLQQLESRQRSGAIGPQDYEQERARIERALLDHVLASGTAAAPTAAEPPPRPSWRMTALLSLAVLVLAGIGYSITGAPELATGPVPTAAQGGAASPHEMSGEQFAAAVEQMAERLQSEPDNVDGWAMLARSYVQLGRFDAALPAFAKAVALAGENAGLLADYADAMAVQNTRSLEGEPSRLVERALKADPSNLKALALAGTAAFNRKDYAGAVKHWEKLAQVAPADSPWRGQLEGSIAEARQLGGLLPAAPPAPMAAARPGPSTAAAPATAPAPAPAAAGTTVSGTVRLAPAIAKQASPDDVVFLYARPAEGSRMPLAIVRKQVKDLPFEFALDDAMAMSPAAKLSLFPKVVIDARVSKSGQAQAQPGDLAGRTAPIANDASGVVVEINEIIKN
jgi:cytochrome c-type biogenesis protein CcmH